MSEKYAFIAAQYADPTVAAVDAPTIAQMTGWLSVSKSGYYEWLNRPPSDTQARREDLALRVKALFDEFDGIYGYRRIHAELVRAGEHVGDELVRTLMREMNLVAVQPKPYKRTTIPGELAQPVADLVCRDFSAERPGAKLVGDISYIPTWEGWVFLATVIDCFNKEVIGYAMAEHMRTELVTDALAMAARNHILESSRIALCIPIVAPNIPRRNTPRHLNNSACGNRWAAPVFVGIMRSRNRFSPA